MVSNKSFYLGVIFLLASLLSGCANQSKKEQKAFLELFQQKHFVKAHELLKGGTLKKENKDTLLYLMELGTLYFYQKKYKESAKVFVKANELVDQLYTKSVKEMVLSSVINDRSQTFYGPIFERSLLYQYQALSFYKLSKKGFFYQEKQVDGVVTKVKVFLSKDEVRKNLNRVRSTLISWDSFFQEISRIKGVKTFLKFDLLAKLMAAKLHGALGEKRDIEISLQLYKDAYDIFVELAPTQKIFNREFLKYSRDLKSLYNKEIQRSKLLSKAKNENYQNLKNYLVFKILSLTKKHQRNSYHRLLRQYKPVEKIRNKLSKSKVNNVSIVFEKGIISQLKGKNYSYNLRSAAENIENPGTRRLVNSIGIPVLTYFALGPLGLGYVSQHGNATVFARHGAGEALTKEVGIEFELPFAAPSNEKNTYKVEIHKNNKKLLEKDLIYLSSLSDIAFINSEEMVEKSFKKRAVRVGVKYLTAIIAAYGTYKNIQKAGGELFAKPAALAQFLVSQKVIKESERADTRHWSTLPDSLLSTELLLSPGEYQLFFVEYSGDRKVKLKNLSLGSFLVSKKGKSFFTYRAF